MDGRSIILENCEMMRVTVKYIVLKKQDLISEPAKIKRQFVYTQDDCRDSRKPSSKSILNIHYKLNLNLFTTVCLKMASTLRSAIVSDEFLALVVRVVKEGDGALGQCKLLELVSRYLDGLRYHLTAFLCCSLMWLGQGNQIPMLSDFLCLEKA